MYRVDRHRVIELIQLSLIDLRQTFHYAIHNAPQIQHYVAHAPRGNTTLCCIFMYFYAVIYIIYTNINKKPFFLSIKNTYVTSLTIVAITVIVKSLPEA